MKTYRAMPAVADVVSDGDGRLTSTAGTVYERDAQPKWTGLYDHGGNRLYAFDEREPLGFWLG